MSQEDYNQGYADCDKFRDDFWKQIEALEPIKQSVFRLILHQGLCDHCRKIVKRFIHD